MNIQGHQGNAALARWGYFSGHAIYQGASWGVLTDVFVHFEPLHLIFNLYWLWILGGAFERTFGPLRMLLFVLVSAYVSSALQLYAGYGVGLSGVGYALFGFGWVSCKRYPEFARTMNQRTIQMFVLWGIACVYMTYAHIMAIGNLAHLAGLLFGAACAGLILFPAARIAIAAGLVILASGSVAVQVWNPLSSDWLAEQAYRAEVRNNLPKANDLLDQALNRGADPVWVWSSKAQNYGELGDAHGYKVAIDNLRQLAPDKAANLIDYYGDPDKPRPPDTGSVVK